MLEGGERYIRKWQEGLRCGFTTGTCAAAAAKAAVGSLLHGTRQTCVSLRLPEGSVVTLPVFEVPASWEESRGQAAEYYVRKDAGDDPDSTNGAEIHIRASWERPLGFSLSTAFQDADFPHLYLEGGEGVGRVTKAGLSQRPGQAAINPVPREMIFAAARSVLGDAPLERDLFLLLSVPGGGLLAKRTLNAMLGIEDGISILGTTGIVEPMSDKAVVDAMELQVRQLHLQNMDTIVYVPGKYGTRYARELFQGFPVAPPVVQCANYIGEALDLAVYYHFQYILLLGSIGKLCKLAAGIMNTHSHMADGRWEIFTAHAALSGLPYEKLCLLRELPTTEEMLFKLEDWGYRERVIRSMLSEIEKHLSRRLRGRAEFSVLLYSERFGNLGGTEGTERLLSMLSRREGEFENP